MRVQQAAALAKLANSPAEEKRLEEEFAQMLAFVQQMQTEEEPVSVCNEEGRLRSDEPGSCLDQNVLLALAPERKDVYISVPKSFE